jgi:hypothetical protein
MSRIHCHAVRPWGISGDARFVGGGRDVFVNPAKKAIG